MKQINITEDLYNYLLNISLREHPVLAALRKQTSKMPLFMMQVAPEQAQFMQLLLHLINARFVLELGTFTGYSALSMALALPDDGKVITLDINEQNAEIARKFWKKAQQEHKIQQIIAPALTSMQSLLESGHNAYFDFIFIDADKTNYLNYYELALKLINPQGIIAIDNIFWDGKVIDPEDNSAQTREIRKLNNFIKQDKRVNISLLAIADGLFLIKPSRQSN